MTRVFEITTEDLILREFSPCDAKEMYLLNFDSEVLKHTGDQPFNSTEEARLFIQNYSAYEKNGFGRWTVLDRKTKKYLGWCGLKLNDDGIVDLGFRFKKDYWGQGYATRASMACLSFGFNKLNLDKIIGRTSVENIGGQRVLEKCGFHKIMVFEYEGIGQSYYYELLKSNFKS